MEGTCGAGLLGAHYGAVDPHDDLTPLDPFPAGGWDRDTDSTIVETTGSASEYLYTLPYDAGYPTERWSAVARGKVTSRNGGVVLRLVGGDGEELNYALYFDDEGNQLVLEYPDGTRTWNAAFWTRPTWLHVKVSSTGLWYTLITVQVWISGSMYLNESVVSEHAVCPFPVDEDHPEDPDEPTGTVGWITPGDEVSPGVLTLCDVCAIQYQGEEETFADTACYDPEQDPPYLDPRHVTLTNGTAECQVGDIDCNGSPLWGEDRLHWRFPVPISISDAGRLVGVDILVSCPSGGGSPQFDTISGSGMTCVTPVPDAAVIGVTGGGLEYLLQIDTGRTECDDGAGASLFVRITGVTVPVTVPFKGDDLCTVSRGACIPWEFGTLRCACRPREDDEECGSSFLGGGGFFGDGPPFPPCGFAVDAVPGAYALTGAGADCYIEWQRSVPGCNDDDPYWYKMSWNDAALLPNQFHPPGTALPPCAFGSLLSLLRADPSLPIPGPCSGGDENRPWRLYIGVEGATLQAGFTTGYHVVGGGDFTLTQVVATYEVSYDPCDPVTPLALTKTSQMALGEQWIFAGTPATMYVRVPDWPGSLTATGL